MSYNLENKPYNNLPSLILLNTNYNIVKKYNEWVNDAFI